MSAAISLAAAATFEQQLFMALEHAADLQRDIATNPSEATLLTTSAHDDLGTGNGQYAFAGVLPTNLTADELTGTVAISAEEIFPTI